ncbi:hypothetical protein LMG27952_06132 [Paraburkholderia hiiakae]|uniref:Pentapeptide MXKDX repeat protein n=1 Tax=Paraburkholderia hiiakae TaxID=1081782 RepID=A0ABM8P524_9BURK|nr:hypothetical protein [Paraburkholderia hiiakae]CAD6556537.1 hypothetical protein LMG27952_06132 [Paraburkholderia hiiakae]
MKPLHYLLPALLSATFAVSGVAVAQGAGGGSSGTGPGQGSGDQAMAAASGTSATHHKAHKKTAHAKKPMNDTTNTPGADASSDTKGQ